MISAATPSRRRDGVTTPGRRVRSETTHGVTDSTAMLEEELDSFREPHLEYITHVLMVVEDCYRRTARERLRCRHCPCRAGRHPTRVQRQPRAGPPWNRSGYRGSRPPPL